MNMRSIYANPYKYACKCDIPIELAKINGILLKSSKNTLCIVLYVNQKI